MTWELIHGDAAKVSELVAPASVDLIVTSPPYFALRSYRDDGEHYTGQLGSEPSPSAFLDALVACTRDWLTVLRPGGSLFVNLGDKYAGSRMDGNNDKGISGNPLTARQPTVRDRGEAAGYAIASGSGGIRPKSLMGLPWRYAIRCIDELGLVLRAEIIWSKPNGLPESVTDRVRRSHEQWFHFTRDPRYFAAIDEVREEHADWRSGRDTPGRKWIDDKANGSTHGYATPDRDYNPLGKVPGSVWSIPSEPLTVPDDLGVDHFAAFPSEWPRRLILGWSPSGYCTACDEPRRAVVDKRYDLKGGDRGDGRGYSSARGYLKGDSDEWTTSGDRAANGEMRLGEAHLSATITGYVCACPDVSAPTRPAVVLDPFVGTGTTVAVAHHLGRHGIGVDLSRDYLRLAAWRIEHDTSTRSKVRVRSGIPDPKPPAVTGQLDIFDMEAS